LKIVVIGAGIVGVTTAYEFAERGHEVTLIDRREGAGLETSFANGGQLGASEVAPWAGLKFRGRRSNGSAVPTRRSGSGSRPIPNNGYGCSGS